VIEFRGGDALQRMPPSETPGLMLLNPPYGERIAAAGVAGRGRDSFQPGALADARASARNAEPTHHRETAQTDDGGDFFAQLASHWKKNYSGWSAWMLTPDLKLPSKMRLKESRRVPMWNGPIECRLFRFDMIKGSLKRNPTDSANDSLSGPSSPANATP
jgi:putative N6-adenine-specific DNA methylase